MDGDIGDGCVDHTHPFYNVGGLMLRLLYGCIVEIDYFWQHFIAGCDSGIGVKNKEKSGKMIDIYRKRWYYIKAIPLN